MAPGLPTKIVQLWAPKFQRHPQQTQGSVAMKGSSARLASFGADRQAEKLCVTGHELSLEPIL